ncbi:hypothetical protein AAMO2058_000339200 [Amorphochlora amoebiformis]
MDPSLAKRPRNSDQLEIVPDTMKDGTGLLVGVKRQRHLKPPSAPDPRRSYLSQRKRSILRYETLFGPRCRVREFRKMERLSEGTFDEAYKVMNIVDRRITVLKRSKYPLIGELELKQTRRQSQMVSRFRKRKRHVLQHFAAWVEDAHIYYNTEWCQAGDLKKYMEKTPLKAEVQVWKILKDVACGLEHIHNAGLVHCDVKAVNIFINKQGEYVVGDFGHLAHAKTMSARELDGIYMARETMDGNATPAIDIFALGLTLVEALSFNPLPSSGKHWQKLRSGIDIFTFTETRIPISRQLKDLILSMLHPKPWHRPTASELVGIAQQSPGSDSKSRRCPRHPSFYDKRVARAIGISPKCSTSDEEAAGNSNSTQK